MSQTIENFNVASIVMGRSILLNRHADGHGLLILLKICLSNLGRESLLPSSTEGHRLYLHG